MTDFRQISIPTWNPPGFYGGSIASQMVQIGREIRDNIWKYPLLPGALYIFQEMSSQREYRVSGKPRAVARTIEWINSAVTLQDDGTMDFGFEQLQKRRSLDYNCIGRTMMHWEEGKPLRYLDPTTTTYQLGTRKWRNDITGEEFSPENMIVNHPIPMGSAGSFVPPLYFILPTAMLAWLVREHDRAAADGRKLRDIMIVSSKEMADQLQTAIEDTIALWTGANPTKNGIPIVYVEPNTQGGTFKVEDQFARLGLANIPENFDREQFQFQYVNEISAALGLALRHFWNSEKATNRALEEVQEARQAWKGPAAYVRSEERLLNMSGAIEKQFGAGTRFTFVEEVDVASKEVNAKVLKTYAEAAKIFYETGIIFDDKALIAWMQSDGILPADLDIISKVKVTAPEAQPTTRADKGEKTVNSDSAIAPQKAVDDFIDYDEITMNGRGEIVERRLKVFSFEKAIAGELLEMKAEMEEEKSSKIITFSDILEKSRMERLEEFRTVLKDPAMRIQINDEEIVEKSMGGELNADDHRKIQRILSSLSA